MRKIAVGGLLAGVLGSCVSLVDAAYVIRLKNGNEYITDRYWHEGTQVLFDTYGGVFGVDKAFVSKIAKSDQTLRLATTPDREPVKTPQTTSESLNSDSAEPKAGPETKPEKKRDGNDPVLIEYNRLKERSKEVAGMLTSEIRELLKEVSAFKNKLSRDSKLFIEYGQEFNDAHEIGEAIETALRSRAQ
jgi:hypothetical protein